MMVNSSGARNIGKPRVAIKLIWTAVVGIVISVTNDASLCKDDGASEQYHITALLYYYY